MHTALSEETFDSYLTFIGRGIVLARAACQSGDVTRAEAILDMIHNLPRFLRGEERQAFQGEFYELYLAPLLERYPDLSSLAQELPSAGNIGTP
jgi:hypothetical protein